MKYNEHQTREYLRALDTIFSMVMAQRMNGNDITPETFCENLKMYARLIEENFKRTPKTNLLEARGK